MLVDIPRLNEKALASLVVSVDGEVIIWDVTSVDVFLNVADELAIGGCRTGPLVKAAQTDRPLILLAAELAGNSIKKALVTTCEAKVILVYNEKIFFSPDPIDKPVGKHGLEAIRDKLSFTGVWVGTENLAVLFPLTGPTELMILLLGDVPSSLWIVNLVKADVGADGGCFEAR